MSAADPRGLSRAVLEQLVLETVRQYARLWETTQYAQALVARIDRAKADCADSAAEQQALVDEYTSRAWARLGDSQPVPRAGASARRSQALRPGSPASGCG